MRFCSTCAAATALSLSTLLATAACGGTSTERVAIGFSRPVFAASPPGDTDRLFVAEQFVGTTGRIRIVDLNTGSITGTFLEIPNLAVGSGGDRAAAS